MILPAGCGKSGNPLAPDPETIIAMAETASQLHTIEDVRDLMKRFQYSRTIAPSDPTIEIVFENDFKGDSQTAAALAHWALNEIGYRSMIAELWAGRIGHSASNAVCIAFDRGPGWHFFYNNTYGMINAPDWREYVLTHFMNIFTEITIKTRNYESYEE